MQGFLNISGETAIHLIEGAGIALLTVIGLKIQISVARIELKQAEVKAELTEKQAEIKDDLSEKHAELVENQSELKNDFNQKHAQNQGILNAHIAKDDVVFAGIDKALTRIEAIVSNRGRRA